MLYLDRKGCNTITSTLRKGVILAVRLNQDLSSSIVTHIHDGEKIITLNQVQGREILEMTNSRVITTHRFVTALINQIKIGVPRMTKVTSFYIKNDFSKYVFVDRFVSILIPPASLLGPMYTNEQALVVREHYTKEQGDACLEPLTVHKVGGALCVKPENCNLPFKVITKLTEKRHDILFSQLK